MFITDVFLAETGLSVTAITITTDLIGIAASTNHSSGTCPACGRPSDRVHSHYMRTLADRPWRDRRVVLCVTLRRFRCANPDCTQAIFCERIEYLAPVHARSTDSLMECHRTIGFAAGGEAGSRLAEQLAMPTSPDTILRRIKSTREEPDTHPRFVGVDDWAWKKGHNYGTILIDLERGRVIDILQGRDGSALKAWLQNHPGVQVITRDRWQAFAQAAAEAAPQATQIADRWHLLKNLREAIERFLERRHRSIRETL